MDYEIDSSNDKNKVADLIRNPGEDNFLALFKDLRLALLA